MNQSMEKVDNRPPVYVPSKRDPNVMGRAGGGLRDSMNGGDMLPRGDGYQPKTSFSYVPSAEVA